MSALNLPSATDVERLERRLRSFSQRLEDAEEAIDDLSRELGALRREQAAKKAGKRRRKKPKLTLNLRVRVRLMAACPARLPPLSAPRRQLSRPPLGDHQYRRGRNPVRSRRVRSAAVCMSATHRGRGRGARRAGAGVEAGDPRRGLSPPSSSRSVSRQLRVRQHAVAGRRRPGAASRASASVDHQQLTEPEIAERAVQVPIRIARRTPSSARSPARPRRSARPSRSTGSSARGPPGSGPEYPQSPRAWLLIFGCSSSSWASISARPGSPTRIALAAIGAVGRRRAGI